MAKTRAKLVSAIHRGHVVVVVGAGVSMDASGGRPEASWVGLLQSGLHWLQQNGREENWAKGELERLDGSAPDALRLSYLADELRERINLGAEGDGKFDHWLKDAARRIEEGYCNPGSSKKLVNSVVELQCPVATTNYDRILELHRNSNSVVMDQTQEFSAWIRNDTQDVLHLHGLPEQPGSVVLGRRSYEEHLSSEVKVQFQRALSTICSCLFVGFGEGLRDLNFAPWFRWIASTLEKSEIRHYVLLNETGAKLWPVHGFANIEAIAYGAHHSELPSFLSHLRTDAHALKADAAARQQQQQVFLKDMGDQALRDKIASQLDGKEEIARALHRFVVDRLTDTQLPNYATKYRIKSFQSIWNKVQDLSARNPEVDPLDLVDRVRDVIGIRIVTLYRLDLRHVVREVAGWFSSPAVESLAPFAARLESVKIHGHIAVGQDEDSPLEIASVLTRHFSDNGVKVETGPEPVASSYSAVHLLSSYLDHNGRRANFEIQLRSALEDIWSEIEHALRYKPVDKGRARAVRETVELRLARYHLMSLKTLVDGAAQYADTIRIHLDQLSPVEERRSIIFTLDKTGRLDQMLGASRESRAFRDRFTELFQRQTSLIDGTGAPETLSREAKTAASQDLIQLAKDYDLLAGKVGQIALKATFDAQEVELMVRMEEALCLLQGAVRHPIDAERRLGLKSALKAYTKIRNVLEAKDAPSWGITYMVVMLFRLARVHWHMGMLEDALELSTKAYAAVIKHAKSNPMDRADTKMNVEIAHYYIWMLQEQAEAYAVVATELEDPSYRKDDRKRLYLQMAEASLESIAKLDERNQEFCNTLLYAAAEYGALGQQVWESGVGTEQQIRHLVERFDVEGVLSGDDADEVHTAFRVAEFICRDVKLAERAARRLEAINANVTIPDEYQRRDLAQVRAWLGQIKGADKTLGSS